MKIRKSASGNKVAELTQKDWESLGKKAGWLDDNGKLVTASEEEASEEVKPSDEMERTAQPAVAPPRPKAIEEEPEDEAVDTATVAPTIASELKRLLK